MQWGCRERAVRAVVVLLAGLALAGCNTDQAALGGGQSVAFDTIDGPPPAVFSKLVQGLNSESQARRLSVASHAETANYRVRGYLAAHSDRSGKVSVSWLWDVYDKDKQRALRISGSEAIPGKHKNAWDALDDALVQKIAASSVGELASFLGTAGPALETAPATAAFAGNAIEPAAENDEEAAPPSLERVPLPKQKPKKIATADLGAAR